MVNNREDDRQKAKGSGPMFLGTYTPKLDDKGRLTLPAKFREELAGGVMVTKGQDHCLAVYPREEFVQLARRAAKAPRTKPEARAFLRSLAAGTDEQFPTHRVGSLFPWITAVTQNFIKNASLLAPSTM